MMVLCSLELLLLHNKICLPSPERRLVTAQHSRFLEWDAHNEELEGGWNEAYAMETQLDLR